jgi:hypothetical protein
MNVTQISINGLVGMSASMIAVVSTFQEQLDWYVRFSGSCICLAIGLISLYRAVRRKTNRH